MTTPDTLELRRKAEAATPGPWRLFLATDARPHNVSGPARWRGPDAETASLFDIDHYGSMRRGYGPEQTANAAFIAAFNPATCIALLDRLDALEGREAWQPIETAPRDGTRLIGFTKYGVEVVKWHVWDGSQYGPRTGWIGVEQDSTCYPESYTREVATYQPTHWRPLPEAPTTLADEGRDAG